MNSSPYPIKNDQRPFNWQEPLLEEQTLSFFVKSPHHRFFWQSTVRLKFIIKEFRRRTPDILFCQITTLIKVCVAFVFELQDPLIDRVYKNLSIPNITPSHKFFLSFLIGQRPRLYDRVAITSDWAEKVMLKLNEDNRLPRRYWNKYINTIDIFREINFTKNFVEKFRGIDFTENNRLPRRYWNK